MTSQIFTSSPLETPGTTDSSERNYTERNSVGDEILLSWIGWVLPGSLLGEATRVLVGDRMRKQRLHL